jgi:hypothetical protein
VVEALHAAAFHFEHGDPAEARAALARARADLTREPGRSREAHDFLTRLDDVARAQPSNPGQARSETEWLRMSMQDWACLTPAVHARLHERLPDTDRAP